MAPSEAARHGAAVGAPRRGNRRQQILRRTARLFLQRGFETTSMGDIADANHISKPGLYYHFTSKQALLAAIIDLGHDELETGVEAVLATEASAEERLRLLVRGHALGLTRADDAAFSVLAVEELNSLLPEDLERTARRKRAYMDVIKEQLEGIRREGRLADVDVTAAANCIVGLVMWIPKWYRPGGRLSAEAVADEIANLALRSVLTDDVVDAATRAAPARAMSSRGTG